MKSVSCPSCLNNSFKPLIDFGTIPRSGSFLVSHHQSYCNIKLSFEFCTKCALIRQQAIQDDICNYENVNRTTGHRLPEYALEIIETLDKAGVQKSDLVVEVGANDGTFLDLLASERFDNSLGIEPSVSCTTLCRSKGHKIENVPLNYAEAERIRKSYGPAKAVICRHIMEHIPFPLDFLAAVKTILDEGGILVIEVPDAHRIIHDLRGYELWDEHIESFSSGNLSLLLQHAGFTLNKVFKRPYLDTVNILMYCSLGFRGKQHQVLPSELSKDISLCESFKERWAAYCYNLRVKLSISPKPIVAFGASHPQSNFFLFTDIGGYIDFLIDDDPLKAGKYSPVPMPIPVISTSQLLTGIRPGTVLRSAFGYKGWMDRVCQSLTLTEKVIVIDPYAD